MMLCSSILLGWGEPVGAQQAAGGKDEGNGDTAEQIDRSGCDAPTAMEAFR